MWCAWCADLLMSENCICLTLKCMLSPCVPPIYVFVRSSWLHTELWTSKTSTLSSYLVSENHFSSSGGSYCDLLLNMRILHENEHFYVNRIRKQYHKKTSSTCFCLTIISAYHQYAAWFLEVLDLLYNCPQSDCSSWVRKKINLNNPWLVSTSD